MSYFVDRFFCTFYNKKNCNETTQGKGKDTTMPGQKTNPNAQVAERSLDTPVSKEQIDDEFLTLVRTGKLALIIFVLKHRTDEDHPMNSSRIAAFLKSMLEDSEYYDSTKLSPKTIQRTLQTYCYNKEHYPEDSNLLAIEQAFGGSIGWQKKTDAKQAVIYYYFEPYLDATDIALVHGSIQSNQYLSKEEKHYLTKRLLAISSMEGIFSGEELTQNTLSATILPDKPHPPTRQKQIAENLLPQTNSLTLHHFNQLEDAIERQYQVDVVYGHYSINEKNEICFLPTVSGTVTLNPYALLWDRGYLYLIATKAGEQIPSHYRLDRMITIRPHKSDAKQQQKCEPLPDLLLPYFPMKKGKRVFLAKTYRQQHPHMGIYQGEKTSATYQLECTDRTISILIDYFGHEITIKPSPRVLSGEEAEQTHASRYLIVTLKNVAYENMKLFCLSHCSSIRVIAPTGFAAEIKNTLLQIAKDY